ncbi:MAG: bifunctional 2-polyprenyl-6-hydroxyphenol methylase/3-demethylubiquinol 3-O-methyltransferase UbiG [Legionellaceae bacterium]|nr:bifunctional 2-polyprenyl-6-hydroxyphenol methylase/3-demethylubiquinol 3-O-methyltransferase UbiG [Legionellaceae bacterium]
MKNTSTVDPLEKEKFAQHAQDWWDPSGPLRTLHAINPARLAFVQQHRPLKNARVLDLGCGGGILSEALAKQGACVTAVDIEPAALAAAKAHAEQQQLSIDYYCSPVEELVEEPFDVICCMEMLEHVAEPKLIIEHCARLLKDGGWLFLSTINRSLQAYAEVIVAAEYLLALLPRQTHDFKRFIKPSELASLLRDCELELVDLRGLTYHPFTHQARLTSRVAVNYLMAARKGA